MYRKIMVMAALAVMVCSSATLFAYKKGDYIIWRYGSYQMRIDVKKCNSPIHGYNALLFINEQDAYGGGSYYADVPGIGWAQIGSDVHDALTYEYQGISELVPPIPDELIPYGAAVGTTAQWVGYSYMEDDYGVPNYDKTTWEVLAYETVSVDYGTFADAMKVFSANYFFTGYDYYDDPETIPDNQWEFSESCSDYYWIVPGIGIVKMLNYEDGSVVELVGCKIDGVVNPSAGSVDDPDDPDDPAEPAAPAELDVDLTAKKIPDSIIAGNTTKVVLTALISNVGETACEKGETVDVLFYARNTATDEETLIASILGQSISNLKPGKTKRANAKIVLTNELSQGSYVFVVKVQDAQASLDADEFVVSAAVLEWGLSVKTSKLPGQAVSGSTIKNALKLNVINQGNVAADVDTQAVVELVARSLTQDAEYPLDTAQVSLKKVKPQKSKPAKFSIIFPTDMPADSYEIVALVDDAELSIGQVDIMAP